MAGSVHKKAATTPYTSVTLLDRLYAPHSPAPPVMMLIQIPSQFHHLFIVKGILLLQLSFNPHAHLACYLYQWQNLHLHSSNSNLNNFHRGPIIVHQRVNLLVLHTPLNLHRHRRMRPLKHQHLATRRCGNPCQGHRLKSTYGVTNKTQNHPKIR